jgi:hypothetical protein
VSGPAHELADLTGYAIIDLDPEHHRVPGEDRNHSSISEAIVVGRVDLTCWRLGQASSKWVKDFYDSHPDQILIADGHIKGKNAYCESSMGSPHLDKVLIERKGVVR